MGHSTSQDRLKDAKYFIILLSHQFILYQQFYSKVSWFILVHVVRWFVYFCYCFNHQVFCCGLHMLHKAFKIGFSKLLKGMHKLFHNVDYSAITCTSSFYPSVVTGGRKGSGILAPPTGVWMQWEQNKSQTLEKASFENRVIDSSWRSVPFWRSIRWANDAFLEQRLCLHFETTLELCVVIKNIF